MAPPKPKSRQQQAMPSMLKSVQRSVTVASAAVDNAFGAPSSTGGVGQRSSVVASAAQERHSLLANDGMMDHPAAQLGSAVVGGMGDLSGGAGVGAPKPPKLMKMSSRHIKMKKMMDNITTKLKLHSRGDNIAFGRRDRGDASGKSYNVEIPKNMIVLILIGFFLAPLAFGLYVLFRQLFASEEVHSRYSQHHSPLGSGGKHHPAAYHITQSGDFSNATTVASALNATTSAGIDVDEMDHVLAKDEEESAAANLPEASSEEAGEDTTSTVGDQEDGPEPNLAAETSAATDDEKNADAENNESVQTDDVDADSSVSAAEKGVESQQEIDGDDNEEVDAIDKSDEKETDAKGESDDAEQEETSDKDESDENADAKGESQVDVDTDKKEEEEKSSDENADRESDGTEMIKEKDGSVR